MAARGLVQRALEPRHEGRCVPAACRLPVLIFHPRAIRHVGLEQLLHPLSRALRAFGEVGLATLGGAALAFGYAVLAASPWLTGAAAGLVSIGVGFYMFHTTVQTRMTDAEPKERGSAVALFATFLFTGQASGLWVASQVVDTTGPTPVFACSAVGLAVLAFLFRRRLISSRRAP